MKNDQNGFSIVEGLLVFLIVAALGFAGWYVIASNKTKEQNVANKSTAQKEGDAPIHAVDIKLQTAADIDKLPDYTPESFKAYMQGVLQDNKYAYNNIDDVDTIVEYRITKLSQVNIAGGLVPVDKNGEGYAGGAPAIWVLTPQGTWDKETLNGPVCKSKNGGLIYEEFVKECYPDSNAAAMIKNPNGSITSIKN